MSKNGFGTNWTSLWNQTLERYRDELGAREDYQTVEAGSLEDLVKHAEATKPLAPQEQSTLNFSTYFGSILIFVDRFSAIISVSFGADAKLAALVWGSIGLILKLASSTRDILQEVVDMLAEVSATLPRFNTYEQALTIDNAFVTALLNVYTELICFYARLIRLFRSNPNVLMRRKTWVGIQGDFSLTSRRIQRLAFIVKEADPTRMRFGEEKYFNIPCQFSPYFWGRELALQAVSRALDSEEKLPSLRSFALCGMGGVGKTQIAIQYASRNRDKYDDILWVMASSKSSIGQSFTDIARNLRLLTDGEDCKDAGEGAILKVRGWCIEAQRRWLLVFDDADDLLLLRHAWPSNSRGSILLTSRDHTAAHAAGSAGFNVQPFDVNDGSEMLLNFLTVDGNFSSNRENAKAITVALGGLPLALTQIGGFILQRKVPLKDFLPLYERNTAKIDARKTSMTDYQHTISSVWETPLSKLTGPPKHLQQLLVYFVPDAIHELVMCKGSGMVDDDDFEFLSDEMDLGDAEATLLQSALIDKSIEDGVISIHPLVQAAVMKTTSSGEQTKYFDAAVRLMGCGFPDTWSKDVGHQFQAWTKCGMYLPHVMYLVKQAKKYDVKTTNLQLYGELLLRCSWYLYEIEDYDAVRNLANITLETIPDKQSLAFASALDLSGLVDLDLNKPAKALVLFNRALIIREQVGPDNPFIAFSLNNIAIAYTEIPDLDKAYTFHQRAIDIRLRTKSDRTGNSYSNMSSLLLRMGKPDEAEEMLRRCPDLKDLTDEALLSSGNPRYVGDMVLLSRIRQRQGRIEDATRLASKALAFRRSVNGKRFKTCDSLYDIADLLHEQGNIPTALELLAELVTISEILPHGEGQLARASYKLSVIYGEMNSNDESGNFKARAIDLRAKICPDEKDAAFEEESFRKLCPWMLW